MSFTRRCTFPRAQGKPFAATIPRSNTAIVLLAGSIFAGGCSSGATLHPEFPRLRPASIAVMAVRNATVIPLDHASFGGLLQRTVIGAQSYDVPELLRGALEEAVVHRGYALGSAPAGGADFSKPLPEGASLPLFDAAIVATIESWMAGTGTSMTVSMRYRLDMYRVPTAEVLYSGTFSCASRDDLRGRGGEDLPAAIRRSAHRALADLPRAKG